MNNQLTEIMERAQFAPDTLTEADLARLTQEIDDLVRAFEQVATYTIEALIPAFTAMTEALLPFVEYLPGREFRRYRKNRKLREHRERVAARVPAWKRADRG